MLEQYSEFLINIIEEHKQLISNMSGDSGYLLGLDKCKELIKIATSVYGCEGCQYHLQDMKDCIYTSCTKCLRKAKDKYTPTLK